MLTPKQFDDYPARLVDLYAQAEQQIISELVARISATDMMTDTATWQFNKLLEMGNIQSDIEKNLAKISYKSEKEIHDIIIDSSTKSLSTDLSIYKKSGKDATKAFNSLAVEQAIKTGLMQTGGEFKNITQTTINSTTMQFYDALDAAYLQISSGAFDYNTAIKNAIKKLTNNGISVATYASGHKDYLDVAVRRATLTGINQTALKAQWTLADEMGNDLVEVTAHGGARPSHAEWQGKIFSRSGQSEKYPDFVSSTGYGTGAGLGGWNCRHSFYPYIEGSDRAYTDSELKELNSQKYEYNDKKLTEYEATQTQRQIERNIRKYKREVSAFESAGIDNSDSKLLLRKWQSKQRDFVEQTGLKRDYSRENINKAVAKFNNSDIIIKDTMFRKSTQRKNVNILSEERFNNLTIEARKNGATIIRCKYDDELYKHLEINGATASCIGDTLIFRPDVTISETLEETYHFKQNLMEMNTDKNAKLRIILNEIDAKQYLIDNNKRYSIPRVELDETKKQLRKYQEELKKYNKGE